MQEGPRVALLGGAELDDVRRQLDALRLSRCEAGRVDFGVRVPLLLSSPAAAGELAAGRADAPPHLCHVSVCERPGEAAPADLCLVRPLDEAVLRQLARRRDDEDSERRLATRIAIEVPVRVRAEGDRRQARLESLSIRGCGLVSPARLRPDTPVEIELPARLTGPRALGLRGRVRGCTERDDGRGFDVPVLFEVLDLCDRVTLRALMARHAAEDRVRTPRSSEATGLLERLRGLRLERRATRRRRFGQRVIACCQGRGLVLSARDLGRDGLRVDPHVELSRGDALRLALFEAPGMPPLLLEADVVREPDRREDCFLRFAPLAGEVADRLESLLLTLPPVEPLAVEPLEDLTAQEAS